MFHPAPSLSSGVQSGRNDDGRQVSRVSQVHLLSRIIQIGAPLFYYKTRPSVVRHHLFIQHEYLISLQD